MNLLMGTFVLGSTFGMFLSLLLVRPYGLGTFVVAYGLGFVGALIASPHVNRRRS